MGDSKRYSSAATLSPSGVAPVESESPDKTIRESTEVVTGKEMNLLESFEKGSPAILATPSEIVLDIPLPSEYSPGEANKELGAEAGRLFEAWSHVPISNV
jgi:hypothetical protein